MANNASPIERKRNVFETSVPLTKQALHKATFENRKFSFPSSLNPNLLGLSGNATLENGSKDVNRAAIRRFSNVGDVVTRKLSTTIGWRLPAIPVDEVISQGRMLCGQYIKYRLKRSGYFSKKLTLYRLRSVIGTVSGVTVREVYPFLMAAGIELERMYPKLYTSISRQATMAPGGILASDKAAAGLLVAISHEMLKTDITWGKVVSVFAVAGGLAVDCVCQGHPEYLHTLMDGMTEVLEDHLAEWVATNGGWVALSAQCRCPKVEFTFLEYASTSLVILIILVMIYFLVKYFEKWD